MINLGINTNLDIKKSPKEVISLIKQAGFNSVMVSFIAENTGLSEEYIVEAKSVGLNIPYVHLSYKDENSFWTRGTTNDRLISRAKSELDLCKKYNIKKAVFHVASGSSFNIAIAPNEFGLNCMKEILEYARNCGVKIAVENLDRLNIEHFFYIMDNIKDSSLGVCYDSGHHNLYLSDYDLIEMYNDRIFAVHLQDNLMDWQEGTDWTRDIHRLPFDGKIDFEKVMQKLAESSYNDAIILEVHKIPAGGINIYKDMTDIEYLTEAKKRAARLAEIFEKYRNK